MKFLVISFIPFLFCAFLVARVATADTNLDTMAHAQVDELSLITRYAGMGYNILEANPEGSFYIGGADPGIKSTRFIFKHTYTEEKEAIYNGQVLDVPDQVEFLMDEACAETKVTHAYSGQTSYKSELSQYVDASGGYDGLFSVSFSLSSGMEEARETTEEESSVVVQHTVICNYGNVRYKLATALNGVSGYDLTDDFKYAVKLLPSSYSAEEYTEFLDDWGTHIIETATVGTREIDRSKATYSHVYEYLREENSLGISASASYGGASGSLSLDLNSLDQSVDESTNIGESLTKFTIGSKGVPLPISTELVPITEALEDVFWDADEMTEISQKRTNLEKALTDYPDNKGAYVDADPSMTVEVTWPAGTYTLPQAQSGCPSGWSSGWRYQDSEDDNNANSYTSAIALYLRFEDTGRDYRTHYCTKTSTGSSVFEWPEGKYCIGRYGGRCPNNFFEGYIKWDDEDSSNKNSYQSPIPDGDYGRDTVIQFCCRSDGNHNDKVILPPTKAFVLYRYDGACQKIMGMNNPVELKVHFDDEDSSNANRCSGKYPDGCGAGSRDHDLYFCYYGTLGSNVFSGWFSFFG